MFYFRLGKDVADNIVITTVDNFNSQEKDIVVLSCARARGHGGDVGFFLNSRQLMNLALTRAKETLIVCGHFATLKNSETWNSLYEEAKAQQVMHVVTSKSSDIKICEILKK